MCQFAFDHPFASRYQPQSSLPVYRDALGRDAHARVGKSSPACSGVTLSNRVACKETDVFIDIARPRKRGPGHPPATGEPEAGPALDPALGDVADGMDASAHVGGVDRDDVAGCGTDWTGRRVATESSMPRARLMVCFWCSIVPAGRSPVYQLNGGGVTWRSEAIPVEYLS